MPNKTIYVSDDDLPLFERAQELAGANLSSAIVKALRRFIELEEARQRGLDEIIVLVGTTGAHKQKRFMGTRLARWFQKRSNGKGVEVLNVYHTAGKRFALHTRILPDWKEEFGDPDLAGDPRNWGVGNGILQKILSWGYDWETFLESGDYSLEVFETLEELKPHIPPDMFKVVNQVMSLPETEDLDI
ncbi:MAG: EXLDI protein [Chloroflexota bacterium]